LSQSAELLRKLTGSSNFFVGLLRGQLQPRSSRLGRTDLYVNNVLGIYYEQTRTLTRTSLIMGSGVLALTTVSTTTEDNHFFDLCTC
jgi:hypothetical protein